MASFLRNYLSRRQTVLCENRGDSTPSRNFSMSSSSFGAESSTSPSEICRLDEDFSPPCEEEATSFGVEAASSSIEAEVSNSAIGSIPPPSKQVKDEFLDLHSAEVQPDYDVWQEVVPVMKRQVSNRALENVNKSSDFRDVGDDFVLPEGSRKKGKRYFKKYCMQCHSIYPDNRISFGGQALIGPTMWEVCGRASGMADASAGLVSKFADVKRVQGILWTDGALMNYMKNPRVMAGMPVTMNFRGITDWQVRVDICHYLHELNSEDHPEMALPIPKADRGGVFGEKRMFTFVTGIGVEERMKNVGGCEPNTERGRIQEPAV